MTVHCFKEIGPQSSHPRWCNRCGTVWIGAACYIPGQGSTPNANDYRCVCVDRQTCQGMQDARDRCIVEQARIIAELRDQLRKLQS